MSNPKSHWKPIFDSGRVLLTFAKCPPRRDANLRIRPSGSSSKMMHSPHPSIETKASWAVASAALFVLGMSFGAAWITAVGLKDIASEVGGSRSDPALASSLAWFGSGFGGILMSRLAERVGTRLTVIVGSLMIALGLAISTLGPPWPLWI